MLKTLLEWPLALLMLLLSAPLMLVLAGIVWFSAGRPVFYVEQRVGKRGREFPLVKFRTLTRSAGSTVAPENDERIFPVARFLRRWRLDELPQLVNVLRGEMALVGPRPLVRKHADSLSDGQRAQLFAVRPGVTGPAALAFIADDAMLNTVGDPEAVYLCHLLPEKIAMELMYLDNWSLLADAKLLGLTLVQVWSKEARSRSRERVSRVLSAEDTCEGQGLG